MTYCAAALNQPLPVTERIAALAHADESEEAALTQGLSTGPFEEKWGALTVALWLLDEARGDDSRLAAWIAAGPPGVLRLAHGHLPADLAAELPTLQDRERCVRQSHDGRAMCRRR